MDADFTRFACLLDMGTPRSATRGLGRAAWICTDGWLALMP